MPAMSDTPRTDKEIVGELLVFASFARKLEREIVAVTEERDELKSKYRTHHDEAERITNEIRRVSSVCSELKREVINWKTAHDIAIKQRDRAQDAIEMMLRDSSCRRIPAYTEEQLAAVKGVSDEQDT
jgi:chromosome segregation ATPase